MWHNNKIIPNKTKKIIVIKSNGDSFLGNCEVTSGIYRVNICSDITITAFWDTVIMWAYLDDLLPKK